MDKYNVIEPTDNLEELDADMIKWSLMPLDLRMLSNDECMRMHGCTVTDYYNKIKSAILNYTDKISQDSSNIVKENTFANDADYINKINISYSIMSTNPYIIIITPDIDTLEKLEEVYTAYNMLNAKNKRLSNDQSWRIWSYNVINMYDIVRDAITSENKLKDSQEDNLTFAASMESAIMGAYDFINNAVLHNKTLDIIKYKEGMKSDSPVNESSTIKNTLSHITDELFTEDYELSIPSCVPWFTTKELAKFGIHELNLPKHNYYSAIKEAMDNYDGSEEAEKKVLQLGWNPSVPVSETSMLVAKHRQLCDLCKIKCYDVSNFKYDPKTMDPVGKLRIFPIYIVTNTTLEPNYTSVALSFSSNLDILYQFESITGDKRDCTCSNFAGFKKITKEDIAYGTANIKNDNITVNVIFVDGESFDNIKEKCVACINKTDNKFDFSSIYDILKHAKNDYDDGAKRVALATYIDTIFRVANLDIDSGNLYDKFALNSYKTIYTIYEGPLSDYDATNIKNILQVISDKNNIAIFLESEGVKDFYNYASDIQARADIYSLAD